MRRTIRGALFGVIAGLIALHAAGQVVQTSSGSVEFLGLEKWTPAEIEKRLGYTSPDKLHYCAADLKRLGFPEVSVIGYSDRGRRNTIVTVVEPEHTSEVVYKPLPSAHITLPSDWDGMTKIAGEQGFLEGGILDYGRGLPGALAERPWLSDGTPQAWWPTLIHLRKKSDFDSAQRILAQSDDRSARAVAAILLMNFSSDDVAWRGLVSGLRDPDNLVSATCLQALNSLSTYLPRKVDWGPSVPDLVRLLHGTDLFAFQFVLKALTVTQIDPKVAAPLLAHGGGRLVIAYLRAQHDEQRDLAHGFLVALAGRDLGSSPEKWESWIANLNSSAQLRVPSAVGTGLTQHLQLFGSAFVSLDGDRMRSFGLFENQISYPARKNTQAGHSTGSVPLEHQRTEFVALELIPHQRI
jgi:hypothetical protein